jgi:RES domain-containing protein
LKPALRPEVSRIRQDDTHRLIPSIYSDESVFSRLAGGGHDVTVLYELEGATNHRLLGEANLLSGISVHELLFGVPFAHVINAAFTYALPTGSRFNGPDRGAWYATFELKTAKAEVTFHKSQELQEIDWKEPETFTFDDYLADFRGEFHDIRHNPSYAKCLNPQSCAASQALAKNLLAEGSAGIVYPSVRDRRGTCIVTFRPAMVLNVRKSETIVMQL